MRVPRSLPSRRGLPTSPWIALLALAALLLAIRGADAQTLETLVSNTSELQIATVALDNSDLAQGFTTGANPEGYTLASIEAVFSTAPTSLTVKLFTGLPSSPVQVARLNNPASLIAGTNKFTASAVIVLSPGTTYFVTFEGSGGELSSAFTDNQDGAPGWSIANQAYQGSGGSWVANPGYLFRIGVNGYIGLYTPPTPPASQPPDPANFARGPVHWLDQDEAQASTHAFPARLNEISANKPSNSSGSLDLSPLPASLSEDPRQPSRGFYLTTTIDQPRDARWLFQRTPDGGYAVQDAQSRRYELAPGAPLLKLRLWRIYHHLGRGLNSVQLLGGSTINDRDNRLTQPLQLCLPAPDSPDVEAERARIAVRGRYDRHWTILDTTLTDDGRICAATDRIAWLVIVLQPPEDPAA